MVRRMVWDRPALTFTLKTRFICVQLSYSFLKWKWHVVMLWVLCFLGYRLLFQKMTMSIIPIIPMWSSMCSFSPVKWWPLWMPWSGLQWWTLPGTYTWVRQSIPQPWPPGRRAQACWAPIQEAGCLSYTLALGHICLFCQTRCFYHKTWRAGRTRGTWRGKPLAGQDCCSARCAGTQAGREAVGGGRGAGGRGRAQKRPKETWQRVVPTRSGSEGCVRGWGD